MSAAEDFPKVKSSPTEEEEFREEEGEEEKEHEELRAQISRETLEHGERERRFDPASDPELHILPHQRLIQFDPETQRSNLSRKCSETGEIKVDPTTIIIHLANRHKEVWPMAISSWALYFGPDSSYNKSSVMVWPDFISEGEAEYTDFERALDGLYDCLAPAIRQVIIATDSSSLVQLCTKDIPELARDKDFRKNNPMEYSIIWEGLNPDQLGYANVGPLAFRFWLVPKEMNQEAQKMAGSLIDREVQKLEAEIKAEFADNMRGNRRGRFRRGFNY